MKQIFFNGIFLTGTNGVIIEDGYMVVEKGKITEIGKGSPELRCDNKIDLKQNWVIPGLINTHGHIGSSLLRGYGDDLPLRQWLSEKMWPMEAKFDKETIRAAASLAIVEMLKSGTTTFLEMYHLHLDLIGELVETSGIRSVLTRGMIGHCSDEEQDLKIIEAVDLSYQFKKMANGRITSMLAPHAPYTCPPPFIEKVVKAAKEHSLPVHIHLSETNHEVNEYVEKYGIRPALHLDQLGVFDGHALVAHAVYLNEAELDIIAKKNVAVSHNPISNLKLGSGIANIPLMLEKNIVVSLGTDSAASNNNLDMFQELRMAALIHKGTSTDPTLIPALSSLNLATINGAKALGLDDIGELSVGKDADFIVIDTNQPHLQPKANMVSHLVYSASGSDVLDVYVKGNCVVRNRQCLTIDEELAIFEANKSFERLFM